MRNHALAMDPTLFTEKVRQHLTICMHYHHIKRLITPIHFIISNPLYTLLFISLTIKVKQKNDITRMIVYFHEFI